MTDLQKRRTNPFFFACLVLPLVWFPSHLLMRTDLAGWIVPYAGVWFLVFVVISLVLRFRQNASRSRAYGYLFLALMCLFIVKALLGVKPEPAMSIGLLKMLCVALFPLVVLEAILAKGRTSPVRPSSALTTLYTVTRAVSSTMVFVSLFFQNAVIVFPFLVLRYFLGERIARNPIVFLHPFKHEDTPEIFKKAVVSEGMRFGVVRTLSPAERPLWSLGARSDLMDIPSVETTSDDQWQDWVRQRLESAYVVIIDYSLETGNLDWEIEQIRTWVDDDHVLVLQSGDSTARAPDGYAVLRYDLDKAGLKESREALRTWLKQVG